MNESDRNGRFFWRKAEIIPFALKPKSHRTIFLCLSIFGPCPPHLLVPPSPGSRRWKSHHGQPEEGSGGCWRRRRRVRLFNDNQRSQRDAQGQEDKEPEEDGAAANFAPQQEAGRTRWIQSVNFDLILTPFIISHYNKQWPRLFLVYSLAEEDTFEVKKHIQRMANAACALPAIRLVYVRQQHEAAANVRYLPACTWLHRCSDEIGCCADDSKTCSASNVETVSLPFFVSPLGYHLADLFRHRVNGVSLVIIHGGGPQKNQTETGRDKNPFFP